MLDTPLWVDKITGHLVPYQRLPRTQSRGGNAGRRNRRKVLTIRKIALGVCLIVSGVTLAQDTTYTVKQGDTVSGIASKFGASSKAILHANNLASADKLKLGQKLSIPSSSNKTKFRAISDDASYVVRSGDTDVSIAKKLGLTAKQLRVANIGTNWTRLQIGQSLSIPGKRDWFQAMADQARRKAQVAEATYQAKPKLISLFGPSSSKSKTVQKTYTVRKGDNDWIIAKRVGIQPSVLRTLNPSVKWTRLQLGATLKLPGTKAASGVRLAEKGPNLPVLRSRYAVVTTNGVTVRRGPSMRFANVTQVDKGTRVLVLDHEGSWYKLRFPKGTEAWVRADYLAPTKAPQILASNKSKSKKSATIVASKRNYPAKKATLVAYRANPSSKSRSATRNMARRPVKSGGSPLEYSTGSGLLDKAHSMLGVRYRYGAASRSATDCSGYTTQVFKSQGVKLPRTAREQSGRGQKVGKGELKSGDLVFFNTRGSRVSHVGIYKGNGKFLHASSGRGKVMESDLNEGYYKRRFAGARRVIATKPAPKKSTTKVAREEPKSIPAPPVTTPVEPQVSPPPA